MYVSSRLEHGVVVERWIIINFLPKCVYTGPGTININKKEREIGWWIICQQYFTIIHTT